MDGHNHPVSMAQPEEEGMVTLSMLNPWLLWFKYYNILYYPIGQSMPMYTFTCQNKQLGNP